MAELQPSKLGTKTHWDDVYDEELKNWEDNGDEGEIWFGEETVERMIDWALDNVPPSASPYVVEIGSGNGTLVLALTEAGYPVDHLSGVDYSPGAVKLSKKIASDRGRVVSFSECDFLGQDPSNLPGQPTSGPGIWDLILDKGTFDAIALGEKDAEGKSPAVKYPQRVARLLKPNAFFLITSCNFTEDELKDYFIKDDLDLEYHSRIQHPTYEFGGKKGSVVSSVAFKKARVKIEKH